MITPHHKENDVLDNDYLNLMDDLAAEGAAEAIGEARLNPAREDHFIATVREMDLEWDDDALRHHITAMQRRAVVHDDPACMQTAYIANALLGERQREAVR